jgi:integrase
MTIVAAVPRRPMELTLELTDKRGPIHDRQSAPQLDNQNPGQRFGPRAHQEPDRLAVRSDQDCRRLIAGIKHPVYRGCFALIYACGLRIGEAVALLLSAVDSKRMLLRLTNPAVGQQGTRVDSQPQQVDRVPLT